MKRHLNRIVTFCLCAAMFVTTAVCTPMTANAANEITEETMSFAEDRVIYRDVRCTEIVGTLPAGQSIMATTITLPSGKIKYLFDRGGGKSGYVWADKANESPDAKVVTESDTSTSSKDTGSKSTASNKSTKKSAKTETSKCSVSYEEFDAKYYAENNPDVKKAFGTSKKKLYNHYVQYGQYEGRLPYEGYEGSTAAAAEADAYYDLDMAKAVFDMVNAERAEAGVAELIWDEEAYSIAMQRCVENDIHESVRPNTGENAARIYYETDDADELHSLWHDSKKGHRENYMNTIYDRAAIAVYYNGSITVAYEVFLPTWYKSAATTSTGTGSNSESTAKAESSAKTEVTQSPSNEKVQEFIRENTINSLKRYASYGDENAKKQLQEMGISWE